MTTNETPITELLAELHGLYGETTKGPYLENAYAQITTHDDPAFYSPIAKFTRREDAAFYHQVSTAFPRISRALIEARAELKSANLELGEWRNSESAENIKRHMDALTSEAERRTFAQETCQRLTAELAEARAALNAKDELFQVAEALNSSLQKAIRNVGTERDELRTTLASEREIQRKTEAQVSASRKAWRAEITSLRAVLERTLSMLKSSLAGRAVVCADEAIAEAERALGKE